MRKRDLFRFVPGISRLVKTLDEVHSHNAHLMEENRELRQVLHQLVFGKESTIGTVRSDQPAEDGLPAPPAALRYLVAGTADLGWFLRSGRLFAGTLQSMLARQDKTLSQCRTVLDFGCGCGRVLRHFKDVPDCEFFGADCNTQAIAWCRDHLPFAQFQVNALNPPLEYPAGMFGLVYVFSIFTHLTQPLQAQWMAELRRILRPDGYLLLTVHGDSMLESLPEADRQEYRKGNMVVRFSDLVGANFCGDYHPPSYVRNVMAQGFDVVDFIPANTSNDPPQDVYLMKRRS